MPGAKEIMPLMMGNEAAKTIIVVPLSNDSVHRKICDISGVILAQTVATI